MALYHASSAATDDEKRNELLSRRPADLFVITKAGEGRHLLRQSAQAISIIENAPAGCNVHIVEVPWCVLAVEVFPGTLDIYQMSN